MIHRSTRRGASDGDAAVLAQRVFATWDSYHCIMKWGRCPSASVLLCGQLERIVASAGPVDAESLGAETARRKMKAANDLTLIKTIFCNVLKYSVDFYGTAFPGTYHFSAQRLLNPSDDETKEPIGTRVLRNVVAPAA